MLLIFPSEEAVEQRPHQFYANNHSLTEPLVVRPVCCITGMGRWAETLLQMSLSRQERLGGYSLDPLEVSFTSSSILSPVSQSICCRLGDPRGDRYVVRVHDSPPSKGKPG